jgi:low temperature requirement protein LtrA
VAGVAAFAIVAALWALYFAGSSQIVERDATPSADPIWAARMGANGQYVVLAGLVATAVGCEIVIAHPLGRGSIVVGLLLGGGPLLYVITQTWYLQVTTHRRLTGRWVAAAILVAMVPSAAVLPPLATLGLVATTLTIVSFLAPRRRFAT